MMTNVNISKYENAKAVNALLSTQSAAPNQTVFQSTNWFKNDVDEKNTSFFYDNSQHGKIAMHLKCAKQFGLKIKEFAGEPFIQYNDIYRDATQPVTPFLTNCIDSLKQDGVVAIYFHNVREDADMFEYCKKHAIITDKKQAPRLTLAKYDNFQDYLGSMSKTTRKKFRRINDKNECEVNNYTQDDITPQLVSQVIKLKQKQLNQLGLSSRTFVDPEKIEKLITLLSTPTDDYQTVISTLKYKGQIAVAAISFIKDNIFYAYMIGLNSDYTKYGFGNHLMLLNIKQAFSQGLTHFDLLSPDSDYKLRWTKGEATNTYDFLLPLNSIAKLYAIIYLKHIRKFAKYIYFKLKFG